jgi:putative nucleotidyltransferase with HDIG domain
MMNNQTRLDKVFRTSSELLQIQDLDMLLERMLSEVRSIVGADAGSIYIITDNQLKFSYTQNDTLQKKLPFGKKLIYSTFSIPINNKSIAGYVATTGISVNISDAYRIDKFQPYSFDQQFDETTGYRTQSVLAVPIKSYIGKVSGVIQLINAMNPDRTMRPFTSLEEPIVQVFADSAAVAIDHAQMTRAMIVRTISMIELHDPTETVQHANRVAAYAVEIYEQWAHKKGIPEREIQHNRDVMRMAAMLHDVGKIAIPDSILKRENLLNPEEAKIFQNHTIAGAKLFTNVFSPFDEMARAIALNHHERWDGNGYPGHVRIEDGKPLPGYEKPDGTAYGKSGNEIPVPARIAAIANTYDTLTHELAVSRKIDEKQAIEMIMADSGKQFDPDMVSAFLNCIDVIRSISARYPD